MLPIRNTIVAILLFASFLGAQDSGPQSSNVNDREDISVLMQQVKELQRQTQELREELKALETVKTGAPPVTVENTTATTPVASASPQTEADASATEAPPDLSASLHEAHSIQWRGFGEVDYKVLNQRQPELATYGFVPGSAGNFYIGDFGLFITSKLSDRASVLSEIIFEETDAQKYRLILRRMLLNYEINDHLKLSFGRYQTAIGYYNWAYRSAAWLQTSVDRPLIMEFASNGGILPTQAIGVSATGSIFSGKFDLHYIAEYGSSDTMRPDINGSSEITDENNGNQLNFALFVRPAAVPGLQAGASIYHDKISNISVGEDSSLRYGQTIVNGYVVYTAHGIEFLNEGFLVRYNLIGGPLVFNTPAFYTQFSKRFGPIRPFFRYQYVNGSVNVPVFDDVGLRFGPSFGARYDVNDYVAFKAQLDRTARRGLPDLSGLHLQVAFTF